MSVLASIRRTVMRNVVLRATYFLYGRLYGMDLGKDVRISWTARLDKTNPRGVHVGDYTAITAGAAILSHDFVNRVWRDVYIGRCCFVGYNAIILPGVTVGDHCIIAGNAVVGRDVPAHSVVMGNPAKVVEKGIVTGEWGIRLDRGNASPVAH
jgi:acetyltransferase-like isoleucine patch superfamily enzyme